MVKLGLVTETDALDAILGLGSPKEAECVVVFSKLDAAWARNRGGGGARAGLRTVFFSFYFFLFFSICFLWLPHLCDSS